MVDKFKLQRLFSKTYHHADQHFHFSSSITKIEVEKFKAKYINYGGETYGTLKCVEPNVSLNKMYVACYIMLNILPSTTYS